MYGLVSVLSFSTHTTAPPPSHSILSILCSPVPAVEWFSGDPGPVHFTVRNTYAIFLINVSQSDSGTYGCRVGGVEYTASLTVIGGCAGKV